MKKTSLIKGKELFFVIIRMANKWQHKKGGKTQKHSQSHGGCFTTPAWHQWVRRLWVLGKWCVYVFVWVSVWLSLVWKSVSEQSPALAKCMRRQDKSINLSVSVCMCVYVGDLWFSGPSPGHLCTARHNYMLEKKKNGNLRIVRKGKKIASKLSNNKNTQNNPPKKRSEHLWGLVLSAGSLADL